MTDVRPELPGVQAFCHRLCLGLQVHQGLFIALVIGAVTVIAYSPGIAQIFVFDDTANLVEPWRNLGDSHVLDRLRAFVVGNGSGPLGRPVSMFTFALNGLAAGEIDPRHLKATNLAIHILAALLVFLLAREICAQVTTRQENQVNVTLAASLAAAFWLLHPLHVSTVLYSVQRMTQLSALFTLFGLWIYCRSRARWIERQPLANESFSLAVWLFLVTLLAALSKENGVLVIWLVLLTELLVFRGVINRTSSRRRLTFLWSLFLTPVLFVLLWLLSEPGWLESAYAARDFTLGQRLITQLSVLWQYLGWFLLPDIRSLGFYHDEIPIAQSLASPVTTLIAALGWLGLLALGVALRYRFPLLAYGLLFFLVGHSLESSILPLIMVFEHRNYLPVVGIAILSGYLIALFFTHFRKRLGYFLVLGMACFLAMQLYLRAHAWGDPLLLAETLAANHPDSRLSRNLYANTLLESRETTPADSDVNRQLRATYLRLAREEYLEITRRFADDPGAPTMLYVLDSQYFTVGTDASSWLDTSLERLRNKTLDPIDLGAMRAMLGCYAVAVCDIPEDRLSELTRIASSGFANRSAGYLAVHDFYLRSSTPATRRIQWLLSAPPELQETYEFRRRLILEYLREGEQSKALVRLPGLFAADTSRRHLGSSASIATVGAAQ